ncbi:phosphate starvation-inducible protein PhoH [Mycolicibacterium conceptionense]|uniref:PhoH-like protein n=1 Tax=Mycolicibacterium conceptionense TaxID=451644 RepID=A0A1A2V448_9MYCO|nr:MULTISPECIES: PhoH family protein [Mycolicibacterium]OBB04401.1 phosphate starvation-inducible protein PhoH [Mycolicibacterium conceptionense]OBF07770.1 phosphate starvation-inducible protein PhoH [Mycolicibacterium conceptionense]OBF13899.1 phosphate starvation-inducible protein PhoH [Mycolicibacterium conceptionense]OBF47303.1 phosphate starvation-inducible protein PhoH [Mycolicibacterium conceptionense]OBH95312.1 phosphate starvation-inducible protein PhoH [Mycolicibacterium conceptionen
MTPRDTTADSSATSSESVRSSITVPPDIIVGLLGSADENLRALERLLTADIHARGNEITFTGEPADVALAERVVAELIAVASSGQAVTPEAVRHSVAILTGTEDESPAEILTLDILSRRGKTIRPKTLNQKRYVDAIDAHTIVFGIGPAGTGKTYLAMAKAVSALQTKQVNRIILTRPAVEAGERLGFLPGTLSEKIDPYLRPLYDALHDMMDPELIPKLMSAGVIEVAPLAYMRGRAQPLFTNVLTPTGFRPIGDLKVGDFVIGSDGAPTEMTGVYPQGFKEIYRVFTQDGASTLASGDHLWAVYTASDRRRNKPARILETKEMIGNLRAAHAHRYELPVLSAPVKFESRPLPMDPYALGLLLGDGSFSSRATPSFTTKDPELAEALGRLIPGIEVRRKTDIGYVLNRITTPGEVITIENPVTGVMRRLGLSGKKSEAKFVPEDYLFNSADVRLAVLQGLLDTDGGPVTQEGRTCRIQYTTVSDQLCDNVIFLVESLGGVVYLRTRDAAGRKPGLARGREVHHRYDANILDIRLPEGVLPFRLARKAEKYAAAGGGRPMRYVDRIEPVGTTEAVCISVAAEDSLYVTEDFLLTHNTLNDAFIILDEAQNTTAEQMKMFLTRLGFGSKVVVTGDITQVDLPGGATSGLRAAMNILDGIEDIHFAELTSADVVRHRLVSEIVDAYARHEEPALLNRAQRRSSNGRPRR